MGDSVEEMRENGTLCAGCGDYIGLNVGHEAYCDDCAHNPEVPEEHTARWLRLNWFLAGAT